MAGDRPDLQDLVENPPEILDVELYLNRDRKEPGG